LVSLEHVADTDTDYRMVIRDDDPNLLQTVGGFSCRYH
jgi:hypothetical protein